MHKCAERTATKACSPGSPQGSPVSLAYSTPQLLQSVPTAAAWVHLPGETEVSLSPGPPGRVFIGFSREQGQPGACGPHSPFAKILPQALALRPQGAVQVLTGVAHPLPAPPSDLSCHSPSLPGPRCLSIPNPQSGAFMSRSCS